MANWRAVMHLPPTPHGLLTARTVSSVRTSRIERLSILLVAAVSACAGQGPQSDAVAQVTYSCCEAKDVETLYRPGQTLTIHWIVNRSDEPGATTQPVELAAHLTGPFATVEELKAATGDARAVPGLATFRAAVIRPSGIPDERPVSVITIGSAAGTGYYNLSTTVTQLDEGSRAGGDGIIQVVPEK